MKKTTTSILALMPFCLSALWSTVLEVSPAGGTYTTIQSALDAAGAGDTVLVRAGRYHESITVNASGSAAAPLVLRAHPDEDVIIDGSESVTGWTRCASQAEAGGNPAWKNIHYAPVPSGLSAVTANLYEGDSMYMWAQDPVPDDNFFDTKPAYMRDVPAEGQTRTTIVDPSYLTQTEDDYWAGSYVKLYTGDNRSVIKRISAYSAAEHKITFADAGYDPNPGSDKYALANHISLLDGPGKAYIDEANDRLYYWPLAAASLEDGSITVTTLSQAIAVSGRDYVRIEGFTIRRYASQAIGVSGAEGVQVRGNLITQNTSTGRVDRMQNYGSCTNTLVEGNRHYHNKYNYGMNLQYGSNNVVRNNVLDKEGSSGIGFYGETGSRIEGNRILNHRGVHANGLTLYLGNKDITVSGNFIAGGNRGLTFQEIDGLTLVNNVFHGNGGDPVACWNASNSSNVTLVHNTLISSGSARTALYWQTGTITNLTVKNNILHGLPDVTGDVSHNLYTMYAVGQIAIGADSKVQFDQTRIFVDPADLDFRLKADSPAIDCGTDAGVDTDFTGTARPVNGVPDMGAYEYDGSSRIRPAAPVRNSSLPAAGVTWYTLTGLATGTVRVPGVYLTYNEGGMPGKTVVVGVVR